MVIDGVILNHCSALICGNPDRIFDGPVHGDHGVVDDRDISHRPHSSRVNVRIIARPAADKDIVADDDTGNRLFQSFDGKALLLGRIFVDEVLFENHVGGRSKGLERVDVGAMFISRVTERDVVDVVFANRGP